jgi:quercetin dioxygenase-like cupin family protein
VPIVRADEIPEFEVDGVRAWGLATSARGATEVMLWRHRIDPGQALPSVWLDHEEIIVVLSGSGCLHESGRTLFFSAGDVLIVPASVVTRLAAVTGHGPLECIRAMPLRTRHYTVVGEEMHLPWTR